MKCTKVEFSFPWPLQRPCIGATEINFSVYIIIYSYYPPFRNIFDSAAYLQKGEGFQTKKNVQEARVSLVFRGNLLATYLGL